MVQGCWPHGRRCRVGACANSSAKEASTCHARGQLRRRALAVSTNVDTQGRIEECQYSVVARRRSSIIPIAPSNRAFLKRLGIPTALRCSLRWRGLMMRSAFATSRVPCRSNSRRSRIISAFFATPAWLRSSGAGRGCTIAWQTTPPNALTPHFALFFRRKLLHEDAREPRNAPGQAVTSFTKTPKRATVTTRHVERPMTQPLKARHAASRGRLVLMSMSADKSDCHQCELGCTPQCGDSLLGVLSNLAVRIKRRLGHISNVDWLRVRLNHQITIDRARAIVAISQLALEME